jgi:hypothetical protein
LSEKISYSAVRNLIRFWQKKLKLQDKIILVDPSPMEGDDYYLSVTPRFGNEDRTNYIVSGSPAFWENSSAHERFYKVGHELLHILIWDMRDVVLVAGGLRDERVKEFFNDVDERIVLRLEAIIQQLVPIPSDLEARLSNPKKQVIKP